MDNSSILARLISGFAVRAAGAAAALYVAWQVTAYVTDVFGKVNAALPF